MTRHKISKKQTKAKHPAVEFGLKVNRMNIKSQILDITDRNSKFQILSKGIIIKDFYLNDSIFFE